MKTKPVYSWAKSAEGFEILRDGKVLKTPAAHEVRVPTQKLAEEIVGEWQVQGDKPKPDTMPLNQLAMTALDLMEGTRGPVTASLLAYVDSDLLCHHAEEPADLVERQQRFWSRWLSWAEEKYAARLEITRGITPHAQPAATRLAFQNVLQRYQGFELAGLQQAVNVSGSLILGLALAEQAAPTAILFQSAELESIYQLEKWGEDSVTTERHARVRHDLTVCESWFRLLKNEA